MELVIWLLFGVICAFVASKKGRNVMGWLILGSLFAIFALIVLAFLPKKTDVLEVKAIEGGEMKKCPACAVMIRREATKCRYCGEQV